MARTVSHDFKFVGGNKLRSICATWFVSYCYHKYYDNSHSSWKNAGAVDTRIKHFDSSTDFHKDWIKEVLVMNNNLLNTNKIGICASLTKIMAVIVEPLVPPPQKTKTPKALVISKAKAAGVKQQKGAKTASS